jgi:hypothetical protein
MRSIPELAEAAFDGHCTLANPRFPLVEELKEVLAAALTTSQKNEDATDSDGQIADCYF